jgi:hypothetical protein
MEYLLHKDFQEIAQRHALQTSSIFNKKLNSGGGLVFYDSFLFANLFLENNHKLMLQELEKLESIEKSNENQRSKRLHLKTILKNDFWFIDGQSPFFRIHL